MMLTKLDWFGTLFPRLPVSVMKDLEQKIRQAKLAARWELCAVANAQLLTRVANLLHLFIHIHFRVSTPLDYSKAFLKLCQKKKNSGVIFV